MGGVVAHFLCLGEISGEGVMAPVAERSLWFRHPGFRAQAEALAWIEQGNVKLSLQHQGRVRTMTCSARSCLQNEQAKRSPSLEASRGLMHRLTPRLASRPCGTPYSVVL